VSLSAPDQIENLSTSSHPASSHTAIPGSRVAEVVGFWLARVPWQVVAPAVAGMGLLVLHTQRFPEFFFDDSFISLRYADRLRSGEGLTWTDGERVEGCTNFLWVVLIAGLGLFNDALVKPTRILGVVCTCVAIAAVVWAARGRTWRGSFGWASRDTGRGSLRPARALASWEPASRRA
jgi:hypothetical protein